MLLFRNPEEALPPIERDMANELEEQVREDMLFDPENEDEDEDDPDDFDDDEDDEDL